MLKSFEEYLSKHVGENVLFNSVETKKLTLSLTDILEKDDSLGKDIINNPDSYLYCLNEVLSNLLRKKLSKIDYPINLSFDEVPNEISIPLRKVGEKEINKLIKVTGLITFMDERETELYKGNFECEECGASSYVGTKGRRFRLYSHCPSCHKKKARYVIEKSTWKDFQGGVIQEDFDKCVGENEARTLIFYLHDRAVDTLKQSKKYSLTGVLRVRETTANGNIIETRMEKYFDVFGVEEIDSDLEDIEVTKDEAKLFREWSKRPDIASQVVRMISPTIFGYPLQKYSLALQMLGGTGSVNKSKHRRGSIHLLLIGNAGVGKSVLAVDAQRITPKSIFVSGGGVTAAGFSAATIKDDHGFGKGKYIVKAGALVLANNSTLIVDELDKIATQHKHALHTAMEQQIVKVDKAGLHATFNASTSILACANPKMGSFDPQNPDIAHQLSIADTLLSRFDLIWVFRDLQNHEKDDKIANFIVGKHAEMSYNAVIDDLRIGIFSDVKMLQKYISYAKNNYHPTLSEDARKIIVKHYVNIRKVSKEKEFNNVTARFIEGCIRLSQAIAKLHYSKVVTKKHAEYAVNLMLYSLKGLMLDESYFGKSGEIGGVDGLELGEDDKMKEVGTPINQNKQSILNSVFSEFRRHAHEGLVLKDDLIDALIDNHKELFPDEKTVEKEFRHPSFDAKVLLVRGKYFKSMGTG